MATFFLNLEIKLLREPQEQSDGDDNEATERFVSNIIRHGWLPGLRKLIARASIRLVDFKDPVLGVPILCSAAFVGQQSIVAYLLGQAGFDRPEVLTAGLAGAAWSGSLRSARLVLEKGADPNSVFRYPCHFDTAGSDRDLENADDFSDPLPPLHVAAREGHVKVARLLVERGANVHQLAPDDAFHGGDATGPTALCTAAVRGHGEVCAYLVGLGKGASKVRKAEMLATQHGFPDIARLLRGAR
ncbi:hypothetical protein HKX48_002803 [Thoreauomyces humboldtii]|nr:hypothetical protein HKX48_002803 [Thoreauomyces humboldtii]